MQSEQRWGTSTIARPASFRRPTQVRFAGHRIGRADQRRLENLNQERQRPLGLALRCISRGGRVRFDLGTFFVDLPEVRLRLV